jgi:tetratricopeptide (TPR) repeat protein
MSPLRVPPTALNRLPGILCLILWFFPGFLYAAFSFDQRCQDAYCEILKFRFQNAHQLLQLEKKEDPSNLIPYYLENYIDFFTLFTSENRVDFEQKKKVVSARIKLLESGDKKSPFYRFTLAGVNLQWALTRLKFGEYATAAWELKQAYDLLNDNQSLFPGFLPDDVGMGILHILVGLIPEDYQWLSKIAGLEGGIDQGVSELNGILNYRGNDPVFILFKPEACIYLAFVDANLGIHAKDAVEMVGTFDRDTSLMRFRNSPVLLFAKVSIFMKNGKNKEALDLLRDYQPETNVYPLDFLEFQTGLALLNCLDLTAETHFREFLDEFQGINYIKSAYQKLAWCYLLQGDTNSYIREITNAGKKGFAVVDEDKQAYSEYNVWIRPAIPLLKSRLLFDGGYYQQALDILLNTSLEKYIRGKKDLMEYTYRLGRIYHEMGNIPKAIYYYTMTLNNGKKLPYYFAANAALKLGNIYEMQGNYLAADSNYRICTSLKYDEYSTSIRQKAKAGISRMKHLQH